MWHPTTNTATTLRGLHAEPTCFCIHVPPPKLSQPVPSAGSSVSSLDDAPPSPVRFAPPPLLAMVACEDGVVRVWRVATDSSPLERGRGQCSSRLMRLRRWHRRDVASWSAVFAAVPTITRTSQVCAVGVAACEVAHRAPCVRNLLYNVCNEQNNRSLRRVGALESEFRAAEGTQASARQRVPSSPPAVLHPDSPSPTKLTAVLYVQCERVNTGVGGA